ncbi:MAG: hypothetical protein Q9201_003671 [Fulgogasparrea decipioides]
MAAQEEDTDLLAVSEEETNSEREVDIHDIPLYTGHGQEGDSHGSDFLENGLAVKEEPGMSSPTYAGYGEVKSLTNVNTQARSGTNVQGATLSAHVLQRRGPTMRSLSGDEFDLGEWLESGGWWRATLRNMQQERVSGPHSPMETDNEEDTSNEGVYQPLNGRTSRSPQIPASEATTELENNYYVRSARHMDTDDDETDKENRPTCTGQTAAIPYNLTDSFHDIGAPTIPIYGRDADDGIFQGLHGFPTVKMAAAEYDALSTSMDESEDDWNKENRTAAGPDLNISVDADAEMTEETGNEADDEAETETVNWPSRNRAEVALQAGRVRREDFFRTHPVVRSGPKQSTEDLEDHEDDDDHFMMGRLNSVPTVCLVVVLVMKVEIGQERLLGQ